MHADADTFSWGWRMAYYIIAAEAPLPQTPEEFHLEFYNEYAMAELGGELSLVGIAGIARRRWDMLREHVARVKPAAGKPATRSLQGGYEIEAIDPRHRMPDLLSAMKLHYFNKKFPPSFHGKNSVFFMWLDGFAGLFPDEVIAFLKKSVPNLPSETYTTFVENGVKYLEWEKHRFSYLVMFPGGKMVQKGKPFDTRNHRTHFSGPGWAIYVVSPSGLWYAGSHVVGQFQHSSFLAGRPVLAAGEIQVQNGVPTVITAKSGHYTPTMEQFIAGLESLKKCGVDMVSLKALVKDNATGQRVQISASAFMVNAALRARHSVW